MRTLLNIELLLTAVLCIGCADLPRSGCASSIRTFDDNREATARGPATERNLIHEDAAILDASTPDRADLTSGRSLNPGNFNWPALSNLQGDNPPQSPALVLTAAINPLSVSLCPRVISISRH